MFCLDDDKIPTNLSTEYRKSCIWLFFKPSFTAPQFWLFYDLWKKNHKSKSVPVYEDLSVCPLKHIHLYYNVNKACIDLIILLHKKKQTSKKFSRNKNVSLLSLSSHWTDVFFFPFFQSDLALSEQRKVSNLPSCSWVRENGSIW